ncbi:MAG: hypothetical protein JXN63_02055 [Candidatus Delongbacteria bacterium]|nr:hypothetical protein [Candidatus Delongbacteria bacterium]
MKFFIGTLITVLTALLILSCVSQDKNYSVKELNGVKYYNNNGLPNGTYSPKATLLFELKGPENVPDSMAGFGNIYNVITDLNDNIYILDGEHATIKKYNRNGEFERYFPEQSGISVEQFQNPTQFAMLYDTLLVFDPPSGKYVRYLNNGKFIESQFVMAGLRPVSLQSDGKTNLSSFAPTIENIDSVSYSVNKLCVLNGKLKIEFVVREMKIPMDENFFFPDILTSYFAKDGLFYIAENTSGMYKIYVADNRGRMIYETEKSYEKIPYNEYEREQLNEFIVASNFDPLDPSKEYYKKAVNQIQVDKKDRIWAQPSMIRTEANQDSFYVDIFDGGVFINRTVLDFASGNEIFMLRGNRLFVIADDRRSVRVYDYE